MVIIPTGSLCNFTEDYAHHLSKSCKDALCMTWMLEAKECGRKITSRRNNVPFACLFDETRLAPAAVQAPVCSLA